MATASLLPTDALQGWGVHLFEWVEVGDLSASFSFFKYFWDSCFGSHCVGLSLVAPLLILPSALLHKFLCSCLLSAYDVFVSLIVSVSQSAFVVQQVLYLSQHRLRFCVRQCDVHDGGVV